MKKRDFITVGDAPIDKYVFDAIVLFNSGVDELEIVGRGRNIYKAVGVFNALRERLSETLKVVEVEIGSERRGRKTVPYIKIVVYQPPPL
ncbi:DNA-binding protein [Ignicoccus pacificus DSM 13166]|uniref:DNA-binding protein n=1 Tax=Ignicoccus pacificus DSM 13166 TaxID=940294 RepID=A0A977PL23_9CREN|nr:DNA-binding protein [Ignicoccus pacificus DSM 13166]